MVTIEEKRVRQTTPAGFTSEPPKIPLSEVQTIVNWIVGQSGVSIPQIPLSQFQAMVNGIVQQPGVPVPLANALMAASWLAEVRAFRELEEKLMLEGKYEASLQDHRVYLTDLIAQGETVVWAARKRGLDATPVKFTIDDLDSTLESLHTTFRGEHGPQNPQKTNELISQLFDVSEP